MIVLIDTNVIIDFLLTRQPFYAAAAKVIDKCASLEIKGYIAFHTIPTLWYILRKIPEDKRRAWLMDVCSILHVVSVGHKQVIEAINMHEFTDFEDCLQDRCAESIGAEYIITRNVADFNTSCVKAIQPLDFLEL